MYYCNLSFVIPTCQLHLIQPDTTYFNTFYLLISFSEVLGMSNDGSLSMISNNDHMIWKVFNIRNIRSTDTKTDTNVTTGR